MNNYNFIFKYIIIGDTGVGKSCLLVRFTDDRFNEKQDTTIGMEFASKSLKIKSKHLKLQIWDTAGQEHFRSIARSYYKGAAGAFLVFDITRRETFENVSQWLADINQYANTNMIIMLIGNKTDLEDQRQVSQSEAEELAEKYKLIYLETSAKTGSVVKEAFERSAEEILKMIDKGEIDPTSESSGVRCGDEEARTIYRRKSLTTENSKKKIKTQCC